MSHVLVTGCSSGFGLEIAVELAQRDWHVFATMRNLDKRGRLESFLTRSDKVDGEMKAKFSLSVYYEPEGGDAQ